MNTIGDVSHMTIHTRFHGDLAIVEDDLITLSPEILGFPEDRQFVLVPHRPDSPFLYLQSITTPALAFIAIDPLLVMPDYTVSPSEIQNLGDPSEWAVLCLCSIGHGDNGTVNLKSPIVINRSMRHGGQYVLSSSYSFQHPLFRG